MGCLISVYIARTHTHCKIKYFTGGNHWGPGTVASWFLGPQWLPPWELCDFTVGIGSCFYPITHGNEGHCLLANCIILFTPFSNDSATGHRIICTLSMGVTGTGSWTTNWFFKTSSVYLDPIGTSKLIQNSVNWHNRKERNLSVPQILQISPQNQHSIQYYLCHQVSQRLSPCHLYVIEVRFFTIVFILRLMHTAGSEWQLKNKYYCHIS